MDHVARSQIDALRVRVENLERQIRPIYDHLGITPPIPVAPADDVDPQVLSLVQQGNAIAAIKRHRDLTGVDLASAKSVIDRIQAERGL